MNIIIVGNGKVGYTLAQYLSKDGHDITILDRSQQALNKASETLDVMCIRGNGANVKTLIEANVEAADVIIAVTGNDELNMVCCLAAKQLGAKYTIARNLKSINLNRNAEGINAEKIISGEKRQGGSLAGSPVRLFFCKKRKKINPKLNIPG